MWLFKSIWGCVRHMAGVFFFLKEEATIGQTHSPLEVRIRGQKKARDSIYIYICMVLDNLKEKTAGCRRKTVRRERRKRVKRRRCPVAR